MDSNGTNHILHCGFDLDSSYFLRSYLDGGTYEDYIIAGLIQLGGKRYLVVMSFWKNECEKYGDNYTVDFVEITKTQDEKYNMVFVTDAILYDSLLNYWFSDDNEDEKIPIEDLCESTLIQIGDNLYDSFVSLNNEEEATTFAIIDTVFYHDKKIHICIPVVEQDDGTYTYQVVQDGILVEVNEYLLVEVVDFDNKTCDPEHAKTWEPLVDDSIYEALRR